MKDRLAANLDIPRSPLGTCGPRYIVSSVVDKNLSVGERRVRFMGPKRPLDRPIRRLRRSVLINKLLVLLDGVWE